MRRPKIHPFAGGRLILLVPLLALFAWSCGTPKKPKKISYINEESIPGKIAVLPARFLSDGG